MVDLQTRLEAAHRAQVDVVTTDMQLLFHQRAFFKDDKEVELYLFNTCLLVAKVKKRRADGVEPLSLHSKPIPIDNVSCDDLADGEDRLVVIRNLDAGLSRGDSMRGSLTRRSSVYSKTCFTIKVWSGVGCSASNRVLAEGTLCPQT